MPISFRITHSALNKDETCTELRQIIAEHNYDRFVPVSHSYGSVISSFIMADTMLRPKVASALFVDPVSFLLHTPNVAYNLRYDSRGKRMSGSYGTLRAKTQVLRTPWGGTFSGAKV